MSYDSKIASARQTIESHNSTVEEKLKIDFDKFLSKLQEFGGTSEDVLQAVTWEDLEKCGIPVILARRLAFVFRGQGSGDSGKSSWVSEKKAGEMSIRELVERYDPNESDTNVSKRLKHLSKGKKCVVFDSEGRLSIEKTAEVLQDLKDGLPELDRTEVEGHPVEIYYIGDRPNVYFDENPLYPGRPLRRNICDQTHMSWEGIDLSIRQFVRIAIEQKELEVDRIVDAINFINFVDSNRDKDVLKQLRKRYPKASILFDKLSKENRLPLLKINSGETTSSAKKNNPFGENKTY
jgi:hypothetical protein